jgi:predicted nucleic acid-binding protein
MLSSHSQGMRFMKDNKIFIDSNLWIYAFIKTPDVEKYTTAKSLIENNAKRISISVQVINEVTFNLLRKKIFTENQIRDLVYSFYELCNVQDFTTNSMIASSLLREKYSLSFWDSHIVSSALEQKCNILYSEDMHHGLIIEQQITIINPFIPG